MLTPALVIVAAHVTLLACTAATVYIKKEGCSLWPPSASAVHHLACVRFHLFGREVQRALTCSICWILGMRVEPPTSTMSAIEPLSILASCAHIRSQKRVLRPCQHATLPLGDYPAEVAHTLLCSATTGNASKSRQHAGQGTMRRLRPDLHDSITKDGHASAGSRSDSALQILLAIWRTASCALDLASYPPLMLHLLQGFWRGESAHGYLALTPAARPGRGARTGAGGNSPHPQHLLHGLHALAEEVHVQLLEARARDGGVEVDALRARMHAALLIRQQVWSSKRASARDGRVEIDTLHARMHAALLIRHCR